MCHDLADLMMDFWRAATNAQLIYSDDASSMALLFYNNVKAMAKRGDPTVQELSRELKIYFKKKYCAMLKPLNAHKRRKNRHRKYQAAHDRRRSQGC
jgi:hypothetical protein